METEKTDIIDIPTEFFSLFCYCPRCGTFHVLDAKDYVGYTPERMLYDSVCPKCGSIGLDCSC